MLKLEQIYWNAPQGDAILKGINLEIPDHKLVVITGPNGGGKTTIAKLIAGLIKPDSGRILLNGKDITGLDITQRANQGISYAFQQPVRFKGLTVRDLVELAAGKSVTKKQLCDILSKVGLCAQDYINREINDSLSGGEIKRIEIATALSRHTQVTIFDEPEAGIDLWSFQNLIGVFQDMRQKLDGTLLVISHQERILAIADEIVVISGGTVQEMGPRSKILPGLFNKHHRCEKCPTAKKEVQG